jgi:hypothetical protein
MRRRNLWWLVGAFGVAWMGVACGPEGGTEDAGAPVSNYEEAQRAGLSWDDRVDAYRKERDTVLANPDAGQAQREAALSVLRADHFDPSEYDRIDAIDREEIGGE